VKQSRSQCLSLKLEHVGTIVERLLNKLSIIIAPTNLLVSERAVTRNTGTLWVLINTERILTVLLDYLLVDESLLCVSQQSSTSFLL
jgi:hypothetical protein